MEIFVMSGRLQLKISEHPSRLQDLSSRKKVEQSLGNPDSNTYLYFIIKTQLLMKDLSFEFTVDNNGEVESTLPYSETMEVDCDIFLKRILTSKKLYLGEKSEGMCEVNDDVVGLHYSVCTELGEDWDSDKWEVYKEEFPLEELV